MSGDKNKKSEVVREIDSYIKARVTAADNTAKTVVKAIDKGLMSVTGANKNKK